MKSWIVAFSMVVGYLALIAIGVGLIALLITALPLWLVFTVLALFFIVGATYLVHDGL